MFYGLLRNQLALCRPRSYILIITCFYSEKYSLLSMSATISGEEGVANALSDIKSPVSTGVNVLARVIVSSQVRQLLAWYEMKCPHEEQIIEVAIHLKFPPVDP